MNNDSALFDMGSGSSGTGQYTEDDVAASTPTESGPTVIPKTHYFPTDVQDIKFYPEQMRFSIFERTGISLEKATKVVKDEYNRFTSAEHKKATRQLDSLKSIKANMEEGDEHKEAHKIIDGRIEEQRKEVDTIGDAIMRTARGVADVVKEGVTLRSKPYEKAKDIIYFPMAKEVSFNDSANWAGTDLGSIGGLLKGDIEATGAAMALSLGAGALGSAGGGVIGRLLGSGAGGTIAGVLASQGLQKGIESSMSIAANPYKEQTFEGIDFRAFSFSYLFQPKDQTEVNNLRTIISRFRAFSKPSFSQTQGIFKYPHEFQIEFLTYQPNGSFETNPFLPEIKYCVCKNVTTNFATREWRSFAGGAPVEVSLQLDFAETELITQEDVTGNTSVGRFKGLKRKF